MVTAAAVVFWVALLALVHTYVVYPLVLPVLARLFGRPPKAQEGHTPTVTFLVPVYNEEAVIGAKIANILALDYPADRLLVAIGSDASTDRTDEIVRACPDRRVGLWRAPERMGKTGILNTLAPLIETDLIVLTDANTMHRKDSLARLVAAFADPLVGAVAGHIEHVVRGTDQREERLYRSFESRQKHSEALLHSAIGAFGGFYAMRTKLFHAIPANAYSNDDVLIPMRVVRAGRRVWFARDAVSEEATTERVVDEFRRRVRIGAGNYQSLLWLSDFLNPGCGWPWFCYVSHKAGRWLSPLLMGVAAAACTAVCLATGSPLYCLLLGCAAAVVCLGLASLLLPLRIGRVALYFLAMNLALLLGFLRFLRGIRSAAWERTERS